MPLKGAFFAFPVKECAFLSAGAGFLCLRS